jgi:putative transposase
MQSNYISTNHSKHYLKAHIILVTKYRKSLLVNQLKQDMYTIFNNIIDNSDFSVEVFESDINHIHFLIRYIPRLSISQIVRRLKQQSTRKIWLLYPTLLRREYWYKNIFWSSGYFVCSIGEASPDTIRQYILSQG